jgi:hypothetical protein
LVKLQHTWFRDDTCRNFYDSLMINIAIQTKVNENGIYY